MHREPNGSLRVELLGAALAAAEQVGAAEAQAAQAEAAASASDAVADEGASETAAIRDLLQLRTRNLARYTCRECGFRARLFYWQCPGCNRWETYAPRRSEALG